MAVVLVAYTAFRYDPGVLLSAIGRYLPQLASGGTDAMKLTGPFSKVRDQPVALVYSKVAALVDILYMHGAQCAELLLAGRANHPFCWRAPCHVVPLQRQRP